MSPSNPPMSAAKLARQKAVRKQRRQIDYDHQLLAVLLRFTRQTFWRLPVEQRTQFAAKVREFGAIHTPDAV